jgi:YARHG domain-containing protein
MRVMLAALLGAATVAVLGLGGTVSPAQAQSCHQLWVERNSYYKRNGYCFRTDRAISYFGNGGCTITNQGAVPLSRGERARIAQIVAQERAMGCPN